jgi:hypothetical protein
VTQTPAQARYVASAKLISRIAWGAFIAAVVAVLLWCATAVDPVVKAGDNVTTAKSDVSYAENTLVGAEDQAKKADDAYTRSQETSFSAPSWASGPSPFLRSAKQHADDAAVTARLGANIARSRLTNTRAAERTAQSGLLTTVFIGALIIVVLLIVAAGFHIASRRAEASVPESADEREPVLGPHGIS